MTGRFFVKEQAIGIPRPLLPCLASGPEFRLHTITEN